MSAAAGGVNLPMIAGPSNAPAAPGLLRQPRVPTPRSVYGGARLSSVDADAPSHNTQQSCLTKIQPIVLTQRWRVQNFASVMKLSKPGQCLRSQAFKHPKFPAACWQLCLYPGGKRDENQGYVSLFLKMSAMQPGGEVYQKAEYLFYFIDDENVPRFSNVNIGEFHAKPPKGGHSWGLRNIPRNKIQNALQGDGSLLILCEVELLPDIKFVRATEDTGGAPSALPATALTQVPRSYLENQRRLFETGAFSDYVVAVEAREFRVHRAILSAQSEVFRAMLEHSEVAEAVGARLVVEDFGVGAVEAFLGYLYTGSIAPEHLEESGDEVLALAEKYGVSDLKAYAQDYLVRRLDPLNVCQLVQLADLHSAATLKAAAEALISAQRKEILQSASWHELKERDSKLTTEILERLMEKDTCGLVAGPPCKKPRI